MHRDFDDARRIVTGLYMMDIIGRGVAIQAARDFRTLRTLGITVRKTIDGLISTCCVVSRFELLFRDRDFKPFVRHLGLRSAMA